MSTPSNVCLCRDPQISVSVSKNLFIIHMRYKGHRGETSGLSAAVKDRMWGGEKSICSA